MPRKEAIVVKETIPFREAKVEFERKYLDRILTETQGNMSEAALVADKDRKNFYMMVEKHGIDYKTYRPGHSKETE